MPDEAAVCAASLAELAAGPHLASTVTEGGRGQARLQQVEATFEPLVFDAACVRSYGQVVAAVVASGRSHRRPVAGLLIAATAHANRLPLCTRNPDDLTGLESVVEVVAV